MIFRRSIQSPVGPIGITESEKGLKSVEFGAVFEENDALPFNSDAQIGEYFSGGRRDFDLPLDIEGTPFRMRIWQAARRVPYGKTVSYGELALMAGMPRAARATGGALHVNPVPLIVPCHRIIGRDGSLTGFGSGLPIKKLLLEGEGISF